MFRGGVKENCGGFEGGFPGVKEEVKYSGRD
jgi:hypothetical protein